MNYAKHWIGIFANADSISAYHSDAVAHAHIFNVTPLPMADNYLERAMHWAKYHALGSGHSEPFVYGPTDIWLHKRMSSLMFGHRMTHHEIAAIQPYITVGLPAGWVKSFETETAMCYVFTLARRKHVVVVNKSKGHFRMFYADSRPLLFPFGVADDITRLPTASIRLRFKDRVPVFECQYSSVNVETGRMQVVTITRPFDSLLTLHSIRNNYPRAVFMALCGND